MSPLMASQPSVLMVAGSQRLASLNRALLRHLLPGVAQRAQVDVLEPEQVALPLFDQALESSPEVMRQVRHLHARFAACDAVVACVPEYNGQLTPFFKNLIDWVSRVHYLDADAENPFLARPVLLCSAATGWSGGQGAIQQARLLFAYLGAMAMGEGICVPGADEAWTGDIFSFAPAFERHVEALAARLCTLAADFHRARAATPGDTRQPTGEVRHVALAGD
jgi:NAD(P)H-dependent FMN reductase